MITHINVICDILGSKKICVSQEESQEKDDKKSMIAQRAIILLKMVYLS